MTEGESDGNDRGGTSGYDEGELDRHDQRGYPGGDDGGGPGGHDQKGARVKMTDSVVTADFLSPGHWTYFSGD